MNGDEAKPSNGATAFGAAASALRHSGWPIWGLAAAVLIALSAGRYETFHTLIESFMVFVALLMWAIAWQTHQGKRTGILVVLANGYFFIGLLALGHAVTGGGALVSGIGSSGTTVQYWLASRLIEALVFLVAPYCDEERLRGRSLLLFGVMTGAAAAVIQGGLLSASLADKAAVEAFRTTGEALVIALMTGALVNLWRKAADFERDTLGLLILAMALSIVSEALLALTMEHVRWVSVAAHVGILVSYWLIFAVVLGKGVREPYAALVAEVDRRRAAEAELARLNEELERRVEDRTRDLERSERSLARAQRIAGVGSWEWRIGPDAVTWSDEVTHLLGPRTTESGANLQVFLERVHQDDRARVEATVAEAVRRGEPFEIDFRYIRPDGEMRYFHVHAELERNGQGLSEQMNGTIQDVTGAVLVRQDLHEKTERLTHSNAELQQFAYAVSHDLQEPLRMVSSYVQLLVQRYKGRFDSDADEFLAFTLDGAKRMQAMIHDLLEYSRVQTRGAESEPIDAGLAVDKALANLALTIEATGAEIVVGDMPTVQADPGQLMRVFLNLIGNALKYRSEGVTPMISVTAEPRDGMWLFRVKDNGIGIDPANFERIFGVFQRLHSRDAYDGTGIGLALCRRIIDRHGGQIWVESQAGQGSVFLFTVPAAKPEPTVDDHPAP